MSGERWLPVVGWARRYAVSSTGRVRSHDMRVRARGCGRPLRLGRVLSVVCTQHGRAQVTLAHGARRETVQVGALVARAFLGPRPRGRYVAHRNDNPFDNKLRNIYYATPRENVADAIRNGKRQGRA